jgi:hypothetical protein
MRELGAVAMMFRETIRQVLRIDQLEREFDLRMTRLEAAEDARFLEVMRQLAALQLAIGGPAPKAQSPSQRIPIPESVLADLDARIGALEARAEARHRDTPHIEPQSIQ